MQFGWLALKEHFQRKNGPRIFQLKQTLATLNQDQHSDTYFSMLKNLWDEYITYRPTCICGKCECSGVEDLEKFNQFEYLMSFLLGLNELYVHARSQILLMEHAPIINKVIALIAQEEQQRSLPILNNPPSIGLSVIQTVAAAKTQSTVQSPSNSSNYQKKEKPVALIVENLTIQLIVVTKFMDSLQVTNLKQDKDIHNIIQQLLQIRVMMFLNLLIQNLLMLLLLMRLLLEHQTLLSNVMRS